MDGTLTVMTMMMQTACLSLFLVVEGPRRVFAYAQRQPEVRIFRFKTSSLLLILTYTILSISLNRFF